MKTPFRFALLTLPFVALPLLLSWPRGSAAPAAAPAGMVYVEGGAYRPLYTAATDTAAVAVAPFYLDAYPVTNADYLAFVTARPEWRRSQVAPLFADSAYLAAWPSDLSFGPDSLGNRPVVNVSWYAAMAYAEWKGKRLPTLAEWELAAAAPGREQEILDWYSRPTPAVLPPVGSGSADARGLHDLHGLVWEWVADFNTALVTGESRSDTDLDRRLYCGAGSVGASGFRDYAAFMRFAFRGGLQAEYAVANLGFRLAADAR